MRQTCAGAVHIDGTARPQLVRAKDNPSFHRIIEAYERLTGVPTVINTSFNMHEEPIVYSPADAIRAFLLGHLDYLAIGDFLVRSPSPISRRLEPMRTRPRPSPLTWATAECALETTPWRARPPAISCTWH